MTDEELQVMKSAVRILSRRPHSRRELIDKLMAREFRYPAVLAAVKECEKHGYLNDGQMVEDYGNELAARGLGDFRIKLKLRGKGLPAALIADKLAELSGESPPEERAVQALERKMPALNREKDPRKRREKAYRFLASRGFNGEAIRAAMDKMEKFDEDN